MKQTRLFLFLLAGTVLLAAPGASAESGKKKDKEEKARQEESEKRFRPSKDGPCKVIKNNCRHAGFTDDGPRGKDLKKDCEEKLFLGLDVPGVHLIRGIIDSCKKIKEDEKRAYPVY